MNVLGSCYGSTGPRSLNPQHRAKRYGADFPLVTIARHGAGAGAASGPPGRRAGCARSSAARSAGCRRCAGPWTSPNASSACVADRGRAALGDGARAQPPAAARDHATTRRGAAGATRRASSRPRDWPWRARSRCALTSRRSCSRSASRAGPTAAARTRTMPLRGASTWRAISTTRARIFTRALRRQLLPRHLEGDGQFRLGARPRDGRVRRSARVERGLLLVGISSDWLFPAVDVRALAERARAAGADAAYAELQSSHGHDGFLADAAALVPVINEHLEKSAGTRVSRWSSLSVTFKKRAGLCAFGFSFVAPLRERLLLAKARR